MAHNERHEELAALTALGIPLGDETADFARHREVTLNQTNVLQFADYIAQ
jgi:hypothetical protein